MSRSLRLGVLAAVAAGLVGLGCKSEETVSTARHAQEAAKAGAMIVDVRTPEEFSYGHVPGAVNIPVHLLEQRAGELPTDKQKPLVVYCHSGSRSRSAARWLASAGYTQVIDLGAMDNWEEGGK